jgi:hypothetical protein
MGERLKSEGFWKNLRKKTRVKGTGKGQCESWCQDALQDEEVAASFKPQKAELGETQIDQYATSVLVHHWLESDGFVADGTAGQFDSELEEGYYGLSEKAPISIKKIYSRKIK